MPHTSGSELTNSNRPVGQQVDDETKYSSSAENVTIGKKLIRTLCEAISIAQTQQKVVILPQVTHGAM